MFSHAESHNLLETIFVGIYTCRHTQKVKSIHPFMCVRTLQSGLSFMHGVWSQAINFKGFYYTVTPHCYHNFVGVTIQWEGHTNPNY